MKAVIDLLKVACMAPPVAACRYFFILSSSVLRATSHCPYLFYRFYRAMHFSAKRGIAIACRLSVRLSVCL